MIKIVRNLNGITFFLIWFLSTADAVDCLSTDIDEFENGIGVLKFDKTAPRKKVYIFF